jgi:hypothetical protein
MSASSAPPLNLVTVVGQQPPPDSRGAPQAFAPGAALEPLHQQDQAGEKEYRDDDSDQRDHGWAVRNTGERIGKGCRRFVFILSASTFFSDIRIFDPFSQDAGSRKLTSPCRPMGPAAIPKDLPAPAGARRKLFGLRRRKFTVPGIVGINIARRFGSEAFGLFSFFGFFQFLSATDPSKRQIPGPTAPPRRRSDSIFADPPCNGPICPWLRCRWPSRRR